MWTAPADRGSLPLRPTGALNRGSLRPAGPRITASARHSLVLALLPAFQLASSENGRQATPPGSSSLSAGSGRSSRWCADRAGAGGPGPDGGGRSNAGIGQVLWVTEGTVEKHVRSILMKLQLPETAEVHRRVLAVLAFLDAR
jgi:hypothetical protein